MPPYSDAPIGDRLLAVAAASSPLIGATLRRYGAGPVSALLDDLSPGYHHPLQSREDLWHAVADEAAPILGPAEAQVLAAELAADPVVPTSNHFGLETVAESVQSTLLFALRASRPVSSRYVAVFGFGSVSMNNWSYPMGLRLYDPVYDAPCGRLVRLPQRLAIFPNRVKQKSVCATEPFTEAMVDSARFRLARMAAAGELSPSVAASAEEVVSRVFSGPELFSQDSYAAQSPLVNGRLWRAMFPTAGLGELVQLQIERVCARLLSRDLPEPDSLVARLLFDSAVRERLLGSLDGERACWRLDALARADDSGLPSDAAGAGTLFFWGISAQGRRLPLSLRRTADGSLWLVGWERGIRRAVPFRPAELVQALDTGELIPSLFTCFATLAFARGLTCVGGYYQAEYLPVMQAAVVGALSVDPSDSAAAEAVRLVPTAVCLAGLQGLVRSLGDGRVVPTGPVELAGRGGADRARLDDFLRLPVRDAYLVAFTELFTELFPDAEPPPDWLSRLAAENSARQARTARPTT